VPVTQVGAVYATGSKLLLRVYIPHGDDREIDQQPLGVGESLLRVPLTAYRTGGASAVQALIGPATFSGRCAVVDATNTVVNCIIADPALYTWPDSKIIAHDLVHVGDKWNGNNFVRNFAEVSWQTGKVISIISQNIDTAKPVTPGNYLIGVHGFNVDQLLIGNVALAPSLIGKEATTAA
jgi:hypothetical protein